MRVSVDHREQGPGHYVVLCGIEFSDEERRIIDARSLHDYFVTRTGRPTESAFAGMGSGCLAWTLRIVGGFLLFGGLIGCVANAVTPTKDPVGPIFFVIGAALFGASFFLSVKSHTAAVTAEVKGDHVSISDILKNGGFSVEAPSPAHAKAVEEKIREDLTTLKTLLSESAELGKPKTFEL